MELRLGSGPVGVRWASELVASSDRRLRPATFRIFAMVCFDYVPGRIWRGSWNAIAAELGYSARVARRARQELVEYRYLCAAGDGWVIPSVELTLPAARRADPRREYVQAELPFLATAPRAVRRYLDRHMGVGDATGESGRRGGALATGAAADQLRFRGDSGTDEERRLRAVAADGSMGAGEVADLRARFGGGPR